MDKKQFITKKLEFLKKDNQKTFSDLAEPLAKMLEKGEASKVVKVPSGKYFDVSFDAVEVKENRLVISAARQSDGFVNDRYIVGFENTRAAYLYGMYNSHNPKYGWSYLSWDIRAYRNHPTISDARVYVHNFRAQKEISKMIQQMEIRFGTRNTLNQYINDNLTRFQSAIRAGKTPEQIEKAASMGTMESLGYKYVEAKDIGRRKGHWDKVAVHWFKDESDRMSHD